MKPGDKGFKRVFKATKYSIEGLKAAWTFEAAFRQECVIVSILFTIACFLPIRLVEMLLLISSLFIVLIVELLNSAIEATIDRISGEYHELSGRAKDIGSAAVFAALMLAVVVWVSILSQFIIKI